MRLRIDGGMLKGTPMVTRSRFTFSKVVVVLWLAVIVSGIIAAIRLVESPWDVIIAAVLVLIVPDGLGDLRQTYSSYVAEWRLVE